MKVRQETEQPGLVSVSRSFSLTKPDGGLIVTFAASGMVEMAWHLYKWGDEVEVIEPAALSAMVGGWQNDRISVLP
ncbi:WYL domain-containing protein [Pararhodobacter sp. SW119]|uniref:WYL domain-containing protein n=1 Tax=Pararhodobacter sp. SW119 TaxID=2780075 RepID=UPI001ADF9A72